MKIGFLSYVSNCLLGVGTSGILALALLGGTDAIGGPPSTPSPPASDECQCSGPGKCPSVNDQSSCYGKPVCSNCDCVDLSLTEWTCVDLDDPEIPTEG